MAKFEIVAKRLHTYVLVVEANSEEEAYHSMDDMIADDYEPFETNAQWDFDIEETDEDRPVSFND